MKWLPVGLLIVFVGLQYDFWLAKGGWRDMSSLEQEVEQQRSKNMQLIQRNHALSSDVRDLGRGQDAIEEVARVELGYIQDGEQYYRFVHYEKP